MNENEYIIKRMVTGSESFTIRHMASHRGYGQLWCESRA